MGRSGIRLGLAEARPEPRGHWGWTEGPARLHFRPGEWVWHRPLCNEHSPSNAPRVKHPALAELAETYRRPLATALGRASWVAVLVAAALAAHWARQGSPSGRVGAAVLLGLALIAIPAHRWWLRRRLSNEARVIRTALLPTHRALGEKLLRALGLERGAMERSGESKELAELHLARLLQRTNSAAVRETAQEAARPWRQFVLVGSAGVALLAALAPWHLVEGWNVLFSRQGKAPVALEWLEAVQVTATPPSYLRQPAALLMLESATPLPVGSDLSVRGVPTREGRSLVLTDGVSEVEFEHDGAGALVAHWTVKENAELRVAARFGDTRVRDPRSLQVHAVPDQVPSVQLRGAPAEHRLQDFQRLELVWDARDDHGLTQVDLVLRSAGREERRPLESLSWGTKSASGGHVLAADDPFLGRAFLPVVVRIEARDNDPGDGNKWGKSEVIVIRPPGVGSPHVARYEALAGIRGQLVELLAAHLQQQEESKSKMSDAEARRVLRARLEILREASQQALSQSYGGIGVPRGWSAFLEGQMQRMEVALRRRSKEQDTLESIVLGVNSALGTLASADAKTVARQLGDVAEEAAFAARLAQRLEDRQDAAQRLRIAIEVLESGAKELSRLETLGADLGSVALADLGRVSRSRDREDWVHAELAALHMAERLHRATPSFGSKGGGGGGVESGGGSSGGQQSDAQGNPSEVDSDFDRMAQDVERLAQEHAELVDRTSDAMRSAASKAGGEQAKSEAKERAEALRRSVAHLPQPGETPGTGRASAALAREHAGAMAHELERLEFERALESGRRAKSAAEEALRSSDLDPVTRGELERAQRELDEQLRWAQERQDEIEKLTEQAAREALSELSKLERELAERASGLASEPTGKTALPQEVRERLDQASRLMKEAAQRLQGGQGKEALERQRDAQRLLEQSETGETQSTSEGQGQERGAAEGGRNFREGGDVPDPDAKNRAEEFRRRVLQGLGERGEGRLSPAVKRYAEGLLR